MKYSALGHRLPPVFSVPLFGDRQRFGCEIKADDSDWKAWQGFCMDFYQNTQKQGVGKTVNDAGYRILRHCDLDGKRVIEVGPDILPHQRFWRGTPASYAIVDVRAKMLDRSAQVLRAKGIPTTCYLSTSHQLPIADGQFDIVISFYSLEHLNPLSLYVKEMKRVLRPGGVLIGAIPSEGGLAWGLGRCLTSRRYIKRNSSINPDKIICWEHPNFAEQVLTVLDEQMRLRCICYWPFSIPSLDLNLVVRFLYEKV